MEAFLTEKDPDIERSIQKDPLREQAIWANLARKLYPHVTSVTDDIKGFIITALGLKVIDKLEEDNKLSFKPEERNFFQIKYEMIIMYRLVEYNIENHSDIKFLGNTKGKEIYKNEHNNPIISSNHEYDKEILVSQERLGYIGRYNSRTKDLKDDILNITFNNNLEEKQNVIDSFANILADLQKSKSKMQYKDIINKYNLKDTIINILQVNEDQKEKYLTTLGIISKKEEEKYLNNIYEILKNDNDLNIEEILSNSNSNETIKNILDLEPFLTCLNNIFYTLLKQDNLNNLDNNNELKNMVKKLKNCYTNKLNIFIKDYYPNLISKINNSTTDIIHAIINDHIDIIKKDGLTPWIEKNKDNYLIVHKVIRNIKETKSEFSHFYYLDAVQSIIRSMDSWE